MTWPPAFQDRVRSSPFEPEHGLHSLASRVQSILFFELSNPSRAAK